MNIERMYEVIRHPIVSEKNSMLAERSNQIVFEVASNATKSEVKKAVETIFKVRVLSVTVSNSKGKVKRFRQSLGKQSGRRKAFVRLHAEDDIDFTQAIEN